jgi:tetratricopeptide (TPR) repeat protein
MRIRIVPWLLFAGGLAACSSAPPRQTPAAEVEAVSLLGQPLSRPPIDPATRADLERKLAAARVRHEQQPDAADALIWLGRRTAYLGRYREAIRIYTAGIRKHSTDARLYRHRGHRFITVRELDRAVEDLTRAAGLVRGLPDEVEPDGLPNPYNIPTSTLQGNIWYHLGLAWYLKGDFERALAAYQECLKVSGNDDMLAATSDWLYMTLRRLGRDAEAARVLEPITPEMHILENHAYHRRLLMYQGRLTPEALLQGEAGDTLELATQGYGVGNWYLYSGQPEKAREVYERVLALGNWPAFGHIAAEADLARLVLRRPGGRNRVSTPR